MPIAAATSGLVLLAVLACPISMVLMMWFMGRGMMGGHKRDGDEQSVSELRAEQAKLAAKIASLEKPEHPADSSQSDGDRQPTGKTA